MPLLTRKRKATQAGIATLGSKISSDAVFQTSELLETLLEHLSWKDLYVCKRVCRRFNDLISDSEILRQKMILFRPSSGVSPSNDEPVKRSSHDVLHELSLGSIEVSARNFGLSDRQRICPFLEPRPTYFNPKSRRHGPQPTFAFEIASGQHWSTPGSWRQVCLTDPPVKEAWVRLSWNIKNAGACWFKGNVRDEEGLTFGKLLDLVLAESKDVWTFQGFTHQVGKPLRRILDVPGDTPAETIRQLEKRLGGKAELQGGKSHVVFDIRWR